MSERAADLADDFWHSANANDGNFSREALAKLLEQYGQEVREAAAKVAEQDNTRGLFVSDSIREMPLP